MTGRRSFDDVVAGVGAGRRMVREESLQRASAHNSFLVVRRGLFPSRLDGAALASIQPRQAPLGPR